MDSDVAKHLGARADDHIVTDCWMAFDRPLRARINSWQDAAKRHPLIQRYIAADDRRFTNNNTGPMINKKTTANGCARMNFNIGNHAGKLHDKAGDEFKPRTPQRIGQTIGKHYLKAGIEKRCRKP